MREGVDAGDRSHSSGQRSLVRRTYRSAAEYNDAAEPIAHDLAPRSFDDLVGTGQHGLRNRQPDRLGSFEIDDQLELRRLLHG